MNNMQYNLMKVSIFGQGLVATHFAVGLERLKLGEIEPHGVPLAHLDLPIKFEDIEIVAAYDVDPAKVGRTAYDVARDIMPSTINIPSSLKDVEIREGIHLGSLSKIRDEVLGLDRRLELEQAAGELVDQWKSDDVDVFINVITTEPSTPFDTAAQVVEAIQSNHTQRLSATQFYAYAVTRYSASRSGGAAFVNGIPVFIANDPAFVDLFRESRGVVFGDDGATGATPLTTDLLEHLKQRNRYVRYIAQFNIGGNTDFLALSFPERNVAKEHTKSSIVEDILGYEAPHYIKPTGFLEPLGDRKFVAMDLEYLSFNDFVDEIVVIMRVNDSPAFAGLLVDLARLGRITLDAGAFGTLYEVNAFFMKKPGPGDAKAIARIQAYYRLIDWLKFKKIV